MVRPDARTRSTGRHPDLEGNRVGRESLMLDRKALQDMSAMVNTSPPESRPVARKFAGISDAVEYLGLSREQTQTASKLVAEVVADASSALSVAKAAQKAGLNAYQTRELLARALDLAAQQRLMKGDPAARFDKVKAQAADHGLRVVGDFDPERHGHAHVTRLEDKVHAHAMQQVGEKLNDAETRIAALTKDPVVQQVPELASMLEQLQEAQRVLDATPTPAAVKQQMLALTRVELMLQGVKLVLAPTPDATDEGPQNDSEG